MNLSIRNQFPSLQRSLNDQPIIYLDGPAGTQIPQCVIDAMSDYYKNSNANTHGYFVTSRETDHMIHETRSVVAQFLGASGAENISFGQNMTTLTYSLSRAMDSYFQPGDEILITQLDHESNRAPWLDLRKKGLIVKEIRLLPNGELDYTNLETLMNHRTRMVAVGWASNIIGTVNNLSKIRQITDQWGAWLLVDAVHYAPHFIMDVEALGIDFLLCSAYKFYGPHIGILYCKSGLLDRLDTQRLRTQVQIAPWKIETGTLNHAALAGVLAAIRFLSSLGEGKTLRVKMVDAYVQIGMYERKLVQKLYNGLSHHSNIQVIGPGMQPEQRSPTISFFHQKYVASDLCKLLAQQGINAWDGHFYAIRSLEVLKYLNHGGLTRMGISIYNTERDIDYTLNFLNSL